MIRAGYLTRDGLDAVRGYYRGVFRANGWEVANAEFYEDEWTFLVIHGEREADIEIEAHGGDATGMDIELSEPVAKETVSRKEPEPTPPRRLRSATASATASATPISRSASPVPQPASAASRPASPAPGYHADDVDDYGDDEGGED